MRRYVTDSAEVSIGQSQPVYHIHPLTFIFLDSPVYKVFNGGVLWFKGLIPCSSDFLKLPVSHFGYRIDGLKFIYLSKHSASGLTIASECSSCM